MGASEAGIPTSPDEQPVPGLRASDAERDVVAAKLRDEYVAGRLSHDTFVHRINAVLAAKRQEDLPPLVADLPSPAPSSAPAPVPSSSSSPAAQSPAAQSWPAQPGPVRPQAVQHQPAQYRSAQPQPVPGARAIVGWLRGAWSQVTGQSRRGGLFSGAGAAPRERWTGPRPAGAARAGGGLVRGATGMLSTGVPPSPLSLRFPRGAGEKRGAGEEFSIGRDSSCDLAIADMTVSRRHATLERTPDGWLLSDLASTNGTRVNGWRVRGKVTVRAGDLISFGNLEAVFARDDRDDVAPQATALPEDAPAPDGPSGHAPSPTIP